MRAVQQAQLHRLVGRDITHDLRPGERPVRPPLRKIILDHPLGEGLRHHRPCVRDAEPRRDPRAVFIARGGHNTVDHSRGAGGVIRHPAPEVSIPQLGEPRQHALHSHAVGGEIVAAEDCEGLEARRAPRRQRRRQKSDGRDRRAGMREVVPDIGIILIQHIARRVVAVTFLRHGERDDFNIRVEHRGNERRRIFRRHQHIAYGADDPQPLAALIPRREAVEPVLRIERVARLRRAQARGADPPAEIARRQRRLGVMGLMRAVEGPDAEMHDAGFQRGPVVARHRDIARQAGERCGAEPRGN